MGNDPTSCDNTIVIAALDAGAWPNTQTYFHAHFLAEVKICTYFKSLAATSFYL